MNAFNSHSLAWTCPKPTPVLARCNSGQRVPWRTKRPKALLALQGNVWTRNTQLILDHKAVMPQRDGLPTPKICQSSGQSMISLKIRRFQQSPLDTTRAQAMPPPTGSVGASKVWHTLEQAHREDGSYGERYIQ